MTGEPDVAYVSDETPMTTYLKTHAVLEGRRMEAEKSQGFGPKVLIICLTWSLDRPDRTQVLIVGPLDSGKSTLARILVSYAARQV